MKGLYILSADILLNENKTIKIGMSEHLENRWHDYKSFLEQPYYLYCYEILDNISKNEIEKLEQNILNETIIYKKIDFMTEYRSLELFTLDDYHNIISKTLVKNNIKFEIYENIIIEKNKKIDIKNYPHYDIFINSNEEREKYQDLYIKEAIKYLDVDNRICIIAPTGFGKTVINFKLINYYKPNIVIIFTPRILLNKQLSEEKYIEHIKEKYNFIDVNKFTNLNNINNIIIPLCYNSYQKLYNLIIEYNLKIDMIFFDEAHRMSNWQNKVNQDESIKYFLMKSEIKRIFCTATPKELMLNKEIYGQIIEKVKVYDLIVDEILCNIKTLIKEINDKSDLGYLIYNSMEKYNKKKGIIYCNTQKNAKILYKNIKNKYNIKTFLYISEKNDENCNIKDFDNYEKPAIIITCQKISMGYDNSEIDFICFGDPKHSDIDIRQICGRGLRWNKEKYKDKILHILLPVYLNNENEMQEYEHVFSYLDYIINEHGNEIIITNEGILLKNKLEKNIVKNYEGEYISSIISEKYSTNKMNSYSFFKKLLQANNIYNKETYIKFYNNCKNTNFEIPEIKNIRDKYKKFCFQDICDETIKNKFYANKTICNENINKKNINTKKKRESIIIKSLNDDKIPDDIELYYPPD